MLTSTIIFPTFSEEKRVIIKKLFLFFPLLLMFNFKRFEIFETTENTFSKHEWHWFVVLSIVFQSTRSFSEKAFCFAVILTVLYFS